MVDNAVKKRAVLKLPVLALLLLAGLAAARPADAVEAGPASDIAVTIYNDDLALIREGRSLDLAQGVQVITLGNVSGQLKPESVHLKIPEGASIELLEQNYDYDLVSLQKLLERFIGREITLIDDEHQLTTHGKLLSVAGGIVLESGGQILLNPPGRAVLPPGAADELLLRPTLSWMVWSGDSGAYDSEITYLSGGLNWNADYVVMLNADDTAGDIEGWVTISNYSGTTYEDAELKLIAGDVNRVQDYDDMYYGADEMLAMPMAAEPAPAGFEEEAFFEYHLYDLQRPSTLRNNQQKQIGLLTAADVPFEKLYIFHGQYGGDVRVEVEFTNEEESNMGMPLPAGTFRLFKEDSEGDAQFIGEDRIDHTPKDEDVRLMVGNAFDITGEAVQTDYKDIGKGYTEDYEVTLKNHKEDEDIVVTVPIEVWGDWKVTSASHEYERKSAWEVEFSVPVPADGETVLTFSYEVIWI
jgi:hypothetical protein